MELRAPHRGNFLMWRKLPKTHKEPLGSLTSNRRGSPPFDSPSGESSLSRFSRAMTAKVIFYSLPPRMLLCSILQRASVLTRVNAAYGNYNFAPDQSAKLCPASGWRGRGLRKPTGWACPQFRAMVCCRISTSAHGINLHNNLSFCDRHKADWVNLSQPFSFDLCNGW